MKDEIKEILEGIEETSKEQFVPIEFPLTIKECKILLDYITNLQEENERLKNGYCELKVKCNNGECDCTNEEYDGMVQANMKGKLLLEDYKSKNEKAIEYINNLSNKPNIFGHYGIEGNCKKYLLNILQGSDKDDK